MSTGFSRKSAAMMILGSSILAMGMCNIHAHSGVTEGGVLGLCYSAVYALLEPFAPMFPLLISSQLVASLIGSLFVGFGAGI